MYLYNLKVSPHQILTDFKEKNSSVRVERLGRPHLNQVIKVNVTRDKSDRSITWIS